MISTPQLLTFVYKRSGGEESTSAAVIDVCFVILFLILWRSERGIILRWAQGGTPAAREAISTPKASTSIVITAEETNGYSHGALIYDSVVS